MPYANMCVATLLDRHPWAAEVLEWHGVDPEAVDPTLSVGALCWLNNLDPVRVLRDLMSARPLDADGPPLQLVPDPDHDGWWNDYVDYDVEQRWSA